MVVFLFLMSYTAEGVRGVLQQGGEARIAATRIFMEALGGRVIHMGFMFGEYDTMLLVELPSEAAGVAAAFIGRSTGANEIKTLRIYDVESVGEAKEIADRVISSFSPSNTSK